LDCRGGGGDAVMATILMVVGSTSLSSGDDLVRQRLEAAGHTVVYQDDDESGEYSGSYDGVFVSDSCSGSKVGSRYASVDKPGITAENVDWGLGSYSGAINGTDWVIEDVDGNGGLTGTKTIYSSTQSQQGIDTDSLPNGATVVARLAGDSDHGTYVTYDAGSVAPEKRVFLRIGDGGMANLTSDGVAILDAAIDWAFGSDSGGGPTE